jgi:hypothetical protein
MDNHRRFRIKYAQSPRRSPHQDNSNAASHNSKIQPRQMESSMVVLDEIKPSSKAVIAHLNVLKSIVPPDQRDLVESAIKRVEQEHTDT